MIRDILENRRTAAQEIRAIERQIEQCMSFGGPMGYSSGRSPEKVPGKEEYTIVSTTSSNPSAASMQHEDAYRQLLTKTLLDKHELMIQAEAIIEGLRDGVARTILRYYYCQAWTDGQIAGALGGDDSAVCKKRNAAVDWLGKNFKMVG